LIYIVDILRVYHRTGMFDVVVVDDVIAGVLYKHEGHLLPTDVYFDRGRCKRRLIIFIVTYIA